MVEFRVGKCKKSGWCCSCKTTWAGFEGKFTASSFLTEIKPQERCRSWNESTKECETHSGDQPELCRLFPLASGHLSIGSEYCGFRFVEAFL